MRDSFFLHGFYIFIVPMSKEFDIYTTCYDIR